MAGVLIRSGVWADKKLTRIKLRNMEDGCVVHRK